MRAWFFGFGFNQQLNKNEGPLIQVNDISCGIWGYYDMETEVQVIYGMVEKNKTGLRKKLWGTGKQV
ncbi:hypothetical protein L3Y34_010812 [Caenorhabditis briggsae]|uniref:Uncharacterized protein n=1 Tax=Caenorhabditis briggsae TaxID=6238 RepID=A0AAE8ZMF0_CAEBR|nr:hypothetical protein L3Y34_010812 [Caenorhabditis briggsae]